MKFMNKAVFILVLLASTHYVTAGETAEEFFKKYVKLGQEFDESVADLYADEAEIHAYRVYAHGLERAMILSGEQWKGLIRKSMPMAKAQNDKSSFSNVTFSRHGRGFKIKANRYSERKCYTDTGYYMIIEPDEKGEFKIIEEYMETQPQSKC